VIRRSASSGFLAAAGIVILAGAAEAKPARCFTTDDGEFDCEFTALDDAGSFEIYGAATPRYTIMVEEPGRAFGFANFGDRNVSLPGVYIRQSDDPACWANSDTETKICAW
jgi:hypothetical protein